MKRWVLAVTLALAACASAPGGFSGEETSRSAVLDRVLVQSERVAREKMPNGVDVFFFEDHRLPRVAVGVTLRRGAGSVGREQAGLADFTAALMERGAGGRDALALAHAVDRMGASFTVSASWDSIHVGLSGLSRDLDRLLEILADVTLRPNLDVAEAEKVLSEQRAALLQALDDPGTRASWEVNAVLYPDHRYGLPLSGTQESINGLGVFAAQHFRERVFVPQNAIVSVLGDFDAQEVRNRIEALFGDWNSAPTGAAAPVPPQPAPRKMQVVIVDRPDLGQARIVVAQGGIPRKSPDRIPAILVNSVLGGSGFSSRLMTRIRSEEGLVYSVGSGFAMRRRAGPFLIATSTRVAEVGRVVGLVVEGLGGIRAQPPTEAELAMVKGYVAGRFALNLETADAILGSLVSLNVYDLPPDSLETYRSRVSAVDSGVAARVAREIFHPSNLAIVVVGPAADLVVQLKRYGTVRVVPNNFAKANRYSP